MGLRGRRGAAKCGDLGDRAAAAGKKAEKAAGKKAEKKAGKAVEGAAKDAGITPAKAKRMIAVGKVVAPLLAPYAIAAAGVARAQWDDYRARRLGVAAGRLGDYSGRGGALHARISRIAEALPELSEGPNAEAHATGAARRFALDTTPRLADLAVAVRAAEQMPAPRRRTAFKAVSGELDRIETGLLIHLGVRV